MNARLEALIKSTLEEVAKSGAAVKELAASHDKLVERSVGAMAIAEGDEGYEKIPLDCPMLEAVSKLRARVNALEAENHELYARSAGLVYQIPPNVTAGEVQAARKAWVDLQSKVGALEAELAAVRSEVSEWACEKCNVVYPGPPQPGLMCVVCPRCNGSTAPLTLIERRKAEADASRLRDAANEVLRVYMPQFSDSRAVDDCLVELAAAVSGVKTSETPLKCQCGCALPAPGEFCENCYRLSPPTGATAQCVGCRFKTLQMPPLEGGHCYMFKDAPTGRCAQRQPGEPML